MIFQFCQKNQKKFFSLLFIVLWLLLGSYRSLSALVPGSEMFYFGRSLESFSLGGVSAGLDMKGGNFVVNPALASTILQKMLMGNFGYAIDSISAVHIGYLHPTDYGVFGGYYAHFFDQENENFFLTLGPVFSKEINNQVSLGIMVMFDYYVPNGEVDDNDVQRWGVNGSLSVTFSPDWDYHKSIFTFREFIGSFQLDQMGLSPWQREENRKKSYLKTGDAIKLGTGMTLMQADFPNNSGIWKFRLLNDFALTFPVDFAYHIGIKNTFLFDGNFKELSFMVGHYQDPSTDNPFPISGGLGTAFMINDEVRMELRYAFGLNRRNGLESYHSLGFDIYFGEIDDRKPVITSPFGDEGTINPDKIE